MIQWHSFLQIVVAKGPVKALQDVEHLSDIEQVQSAGQIRIASATAVLFICCVSCFIAFFFS